MRRTDRDVTSQEQLLNVLNDGKIVQIAFVDGNEPYIVTMNYGYHFDGDKIKLYFHSAPEGRKINCIRKNPSVCFSISICDPFVTGEKACNYGMKFRSIVGYGQVRIVESDNERITGLNLLMKQYTGKDNWEYDDMMLKRTMVTCLDVARYSVKRKG